MMTKIKFALSFIFGMIYMNMIDFMINFTGKRNTDTTFNGILLVWFIATLFIIAFIVVFFIEYWKEN